MATLRDALEVVESLPLEQQEALIHLLQHRHSEGAREYELGEVHRGTAEDLMGSYNDHQESRQLKEGMALLSSRSQSLRFLADEGDVYSVDDLVERYK
jgi:hypothetical protein